MRSAARVLATLGLTLAIAPAAHAASFTPWTEGVDLETVPGTSDQINTDRQDGCPIQSPDGLSLYMASNRKRSPEDTRTDLDIWVAHRESTDAPWGAPENLGEPVNTTFDDFCPTPIRAGGLFFVSRKPGPGTCGLGDIYFTRHNPVHGWREPEHLPCGSEGGPNSPLDEMGPSYVEAGDPSLYFSSGPDIYVSRQSQDGSFGPAVAVTELNLPTSVDIQPNVRKDGREIVFASTRRAGTDQDIYSATRESVDDPWSTPVNLGEAINRPDRNETRPSLSWDATTLYFGRAPLGLPGDIYISTRGRPSGGRGSVADVSARAPQPRSRRAAPPRWPAAPGRHGERPRRAA
jgi:hypothetical protein